MQRPFSLTTFASTVLLALCYLPAGQAESSAIADISDVEAKGHAIALEADQRNTGWIDSQSTFTMTLRDKKGRERVRTLRVKSMERENDGDWGLTIFDDPADVKGTALLTYSHGLEPDDQWIYLPALKRVKRISSKNKSGPFMGSEFAFEDLSSFEMEKYGYEYLRDAPCGEQTCFVSKWTPLYAHSGYAYIEIWIDQNEYRGHKIDFYDRNSKHLKTLTMAEHKLYQDRFWRPHQWEMINHKTGKSTLLRYDAIELGIGLVERDFDKNSLKSAK